jgi:hypothetical protein
MAKPPAHFNCTPLLLFLPRVLAFYDQPQAGHHHFYDLIAGGFAPRDCCPAGFGQPRSTSAKKRTSPVPGTNLSRVKDQFLAACPQRCRTRLELVESQLAAGTTSNCHAGILTHRPKICRSPNSQDFSVATEPATDHRDLLPWPPVFTGRVYFEVVKRAFVWTEPELWP